MKRILLIITTFIASTAMLHAQESDTLDQESVIYLDSSKENTITASNGRLSLLLNGRRFEIGNRETKPDSISYYVKNADGSMDMLSREELAIAAYNANTTAITANNRKNKAYFGIIGIGAPKFNHFSIVEIGANIINNINYVGYTPEEANALTFSSRKAVCVTMNVGSLNVPLTTNRSLVASMALGFTWENYTIAGNYTMEYREGMMRPLAIEGDIKKSKMVASYFHVPLTLDWNIKSGFFISAGVNFDILMGSHLKYKFPKTKTKSEITLNPVQVGLTARIGWKRIYLFTNYAFNDMFKQGTGPEGHRLSIGMGIGF